MIIDALLDMVFGFAESVVGLLPTNSLDVSGLSAGAAYLSWVGLFINMTALGSAVGVIVTGEGLLLGFRVARWVWGIVWS